MFCCALCTQYGKVCASYGFSQKSEIIKGCVAFTCAQSIAIRVVMNRQAHSDFVVYVPLLLPMWMNDL